MDLTPQTGGSDIESALATLAAVSALHQPFPAAYRARLERLFACSDHDQKRLVYHRNELAKRLRRRLPDEREQRQLDRSYRESAAIQKRSDKLHWLHGHIYYCLWVVIAERVRREHKIRKPGKSAQSERRYRLQMESVVATDPECMALNARRDRFFSRHWARKRRCNIEQIEAGVLAVDDRATRRAKVKAWRERNGI